MTEPWQCVTRDDIVADCSIVEHQRQQKLGLQKLNTATTCRLDRDQVVQVVSNNCIHLFLFIYLLTCLFIYLKGTKGNGHCHVVTSGLKKRSI